MKNLNCFIYGLIVFSASFGLSGCSNEEKLSLDGTAEARTPLAISVTNAGLTKVGGVVSGNKFTDPSSLGLFLTKEDGNSPYDEPYNNIQYTSSNSGQTLDGDLSHPADRNQGQCVCLLSLQFHL